MGRALVSFVVLFGVACGGEGGAPPDAGPANPLAPPAPEEGVQFAMDVTAPAQTEVWKCLVGYVPGVQPGQLLDFNLVESKQSANIHHMDLSVLTLAEDDIEPGVYDCTSLYAQHPRLMDELVIYASQHPEQKLQLPPGVVAEVPSGVKTMLEVHYVNTADVEQTVFTRINAYWIDPLAVTNRIWGFAVRDVNLSIPAGGSTDEWTRCQLSEDVDLLVLSTHTHQLARKTEVFRWTGEAVGELIYTNTDWHAPVLMDLTQSPIHLKRGEGLEFHCHYDNPSDHEVRWGFKSTDEMCQMALVYTPGNPSIECQQIASSDGILSE
jgi:Copper type II ascorbate-dependent monooxygenase, C-terminal domain